MDAKRRKCATEFLLAVADFIVARIHFLRDWKGERLFKVPARDAIVRLAQGFERRIRSSDVIVECQGVGRLSGRCSSRKRSAGLDWWRGLDSNQRTLARADLQSAAFNHSATSPRGQAGGPCGGPYLLCQRAKENAAPASSTTTRATESLQFRSGATGRAVRPVRHLIVPTRKRREAAA